MMEKNKQKLATPNKGSERMQYNSRSYEEQFFQINLDNLTLPDKPTIKDVLITEWNRLAYVNDFPYDHRDLYGLLKPQKRKAQLDNHLNAYLEDPKNSKKDFLKHFQYMLANHKTYLDQKDEAILKEWLSVNLILLQNENKSKSNKILNPRPKVFAEQHWFEIVNLIRINDGNVMKAVKGFCLNFDSHPDVVSLSRAVSRLCDAKNVKRNKNFRQDLDV